MTTYYVSTTGDNANNGSEAAPFRTISKAMWNLVAGDEVIVKAGIYNEAVRISKSGSAEDGYITVRSEVPGGAKIITPADKEFGIHVQGDYVKLDGFEVYGSSRAGITTHLAHHIEITNNISHDNGTHGISATRSDFVTIAGNTTYGNAGIGPYSGISIFHPENITGDTTTGGFRLIVRNNISYDNVTEIGAHSDGNGIIMDDFRSTNSPEREPYLFPSLVENNLVYSNGGKGIQVDWSDYVTVRNNTSWHNNVDPNKTGTWHGELSNMNASNNIWVNNIAVADKSLSEHATAIDNTSFPGYINSNNVWLNNLTYNGTAGDASVRTAGGNGGLSLEDGNLLGVDPEFVGAPLNFELTPDSPAIDGGTTSRGYSERDINGDGRQGDVDIGAYESGMADDDDEDPVIEPIYGGMGDDILTGDAEPDLMYGAEGNDTISGQDGNDTIYGDAGADSLLGGAGNDLINGGVGNNRFYGEAGDDTLFGLNGGDIMVGGIGDDLLRGGAGKDTLTGGDGADSFLYATLTDAGKAAKADELRDFSRDEGDTIDLSGIDANSTKLGNQDFSFIGSATFSGTASELRYEGGLISGDINGDGLAEVEIQVIGNPSVLESDFLL